MESLAAGLRGLPFLARYAVIGAASVGVLGAMAGLVVGLLAYAPTAPFAVVELGLPAAVAGGAAGLAAGVIVKAAAHVRRDRPRKP